MRRIDWSQVPDLGKVSDTLIAERIGVAPSTVWNARARMGIPMRWKAFRRHPNSKMAQARRHPLLGKVRDRDLALELGLAPGTVEQIRSYLGIPSAFRLVRKKPMKDERVSETVLGCVRDQIGRFPIRFADLCTSVFNDYGTVSVRTLHRAVALLQGLGEVERVEEGYRRRGRGARVCEPLGMEAAAR